MPAKSQKKTINLALQGGGAHGAFAWGVLDRLLEDDRIAFDGVCATSAGTMNACALAYGMHLGSKEGRQRERGRELLHRLWAEVSRQGRMSSPIAAFPWPFGPVETSPAWLWFDAVTRLTSPYQWNVLDVNPLRDILQSCIDFDELTHCRCVKLFISATNVRSGKVRVFEAPEMSIDVALASACLPFLFKAVEIDGAHYWDGGYMGNPSLLPLISRTESPDILVVHINPIHRPNVPQTGPEIMNRINEISFNASLIKDGRWIAFIKKMKEMGLLADGHESTLRDVFVHSVRAEEAMCEFSVASKFNTSWDFLTMLRDRGRAAVADWLDAHFDDLGTRDTVDLQAEFTDQLGWLFDGAATDAGGRAKP